MILAYVNPFIAQADVMCTTENSFGGAWCGLTNEFIPTSGVVFVDGGGREPMPAPMPVPQVDPAVDPNSGKTEPGVAVGAMTASPTRSCRSDRNVNGCGRAVWRPG